MKRIVYFILIDLLRNKFVILYTILLALLSFSAFSMQDSSSKGILTLLNIMLLVIPLVSVLFSTTYLFNSSEFIELLLSQPVSRKRLWFGIYSGLIISLMLAFLIGAGLPMLYYADWQLSLIMIFSGLLVTCIFVSIAFVSAVISKDKSKGMGVSILLWLYFSLLFDGILLFIIFQFSDYPIEKVMALATATSPVDLARIVVLLRMDASAMLGYTGAVFKDLFGDTNGLYLAMGLLVCWAILPFLISIKLFQKKDL